MLGNSKILLVDENDKRRKYLANFLSKLKLEVHEVSSFSDAVKDISQSNYYSLFLFSLHPFHESGIKVIKKIKSINPNYRIILLSIPDETLFGVELLQNKVVNQIVTPTNEASIYSAVKAELEIMNLHEKNNKFLKKLKKIKAEQDKNLKKAMVLEEIYDSTLENLIAALDLRDVETFGHSRTVAKYTQVLAQIIGVDEETTLDNIRKGALLHDVGKIAIPDSILKKPGPLSREEWEKIKLHPSLGYGLIKEIKLVKEIGNIILCHHERYDGRGYPSKLKGSDIPLEARIFALADALDAITSFRPYRKERTFQEAKEEILNNRSTQFDPLVVDAFCSLDLERWQKIRFETTNLLPGLEAFIEEKKKLKTFN